MSSESSSFQLENPFKQYISLFLEIASDFSTDKEQQQQQQSCNIFFSNANESSSLSTESLILDDESFHNSNAQDNSILSICSDDKNLQKQNIIKNILKGFQKFIVSIKDKDTQQYYSEIYSHDKQIPFSDIKKSLSKRIKEKKTRWNMKLKSILVSERLGPVFYSFLVNEADEWLSHSKVTNLESHQKLINLLINIIKRGEANNIKTYKKK